jgi:bestrophin, other
MPLVWSTNIINRARKDGLITSDHIVQTILMELSDIRRRLGALIGYDTVSVPLVYTQVVTLVLYSYFIAALFGRQMVPQIDGVGGKGQKYEDPDLYFPLFTALQVSLELILKTILNLLIFYSVLLLCGLAESCRSSN